LSPERFREDDRWLVDNVLSILKEGNASGQFSIPHPERDAEIFVQAVMYFLPVAGLEPYRPPTEANLIKMIDWFIEKWTQSGSKRQG